MIHNTRFIASVMFCIAVLPTVAAAQGGGRVDIAGGYAWLHDQEAEVTFSRGWFASIGADLAGPIGIVGQASGSSKGQTGIDVDFTMRIVGITAGPRVAARSGRARPFAQILFGTTRFTSTYQLPTTTLSASDNLFTTEIAGGVDVPVVPHLAVRLAVQRRYVRASPDTLTGALSNTFHQTQLLGGLAFR